MAKQKINLNSNQQKAVEHNKGPLLVVAGAGTGKTRVITERIRHLIATKQAKPTEILALTFTEKASQEMLERLDDAMPLGYEEPWIYTFHAFADRLLKVEGLEIGLDSSYKIISYPEQWLLLRKNIFSLGLKYFAPLGNPTKFISAILKFISRLQDENISQQDLQDFADNYGNYAGTSTASSDYDSTNSTSQPLTKEEKEEKERWQELAKVYKRYNELKLEQSKMDFGDLITYTIQLFKERPHILKKYQDQFKHILVDEFQDTNYAQYELIKLLAPADHLTTRSLLAVGDDSQSIYKFRGAAISNILEFQRDYEDSEMLTLNDNYRSVQSVLDSSYEVIQNNNPDTLESSLGISKKLSAKGPLAEDTHIKPLVVCLPTLEEEVEYVVQKILELLGKEPSYTYKDFAILARANGHLDPFVFAFRKYGLPYQLVGNRGLYDREEVRDITAMLKVIINPNDAISLYRVLNIESFGIDSSIISKILSETKFKKIEMWDALELFTESEAVTALKQKIYDFQKQITDKTPTEFVYDLVHKTGYLKIYLESESIENQLSINNLNLFLDRVKKFEVAFKGDTSELPTVVDFLDYLELMVEAGDNPAQAEIEDIDTINLLTVHASKGLEYPVVFMVNLVSDRFPTRDRKDAIEIPENLIKEILPTGNPHIQEERRLFYVGMTRAQKHLIMTTGKNYGGKRDKKPSGFLEETGIEMQMLPKVEIEKQESLFGVKSGFREAKATKIGSHTPYSLSYSKISDYQTCPLKYKYRYVLNIPTPPSYALSFGITIHDTLRDFHAKRMVGENPNLGDVLEMYKKNWQPLGFMNGEHQDAYLKNGEELLERYYLEQREADEKAVRDGIADESGVLRPVALEKSFAVKLGGVKFFGRIDRIDPLPGGGYEIVDYKTGGAKTQKDVDKDDQVAIYALAAKEAFGMDVKRLTYHYVEHGEKISTERTEEDLEKVTEKVSEILDDMKAGKFEATPGMHCNWCDFKDICPHAFRG